MSPLVGAGGVANEPALSICNDTLQSLLSSPYAWRFNKNAIPTFTTISYQQDYVLSGCQMMITTSSGGQRAIVHLNLQSSPSGAGLTESGTVVTAKFDDFAPNGTAGLNGPPGSKPVTTGTSVPIIGDKVTITGASQAGYNITNAVVTGQVVAANGGITGVTFTAAQSGLTPDGGQGINGINWLEHATLQDYFSTGTVRPVHDIEVVASLPVESIIQPPFKIAFQVENSFPVVGTFTLADSTGQAWLLSANNAGQAVATQISGGAPASIFLEDTVLAQAYLLTINTAGQLVTTPTAGTSSVNQLLLQSPTGAIWALQIASNVLQTTLSANFPATQITVRTWPVSSSQVWNVFLYYQAKAPLKTSLTQTWAPWPDDLGYVLRAGVLSAAYGWFEDVRFPTAEALFQQKLLKALDSKDQEARSESYFPDLPLLRGG